MQIYIWGSGPALGSGSYDYIRLVPALVFELRHMRIVDIAAGDTHCMALDDEGNVYAWGTNTMGQCGQGLVTGVVRKPQKICEFSGVPIRQISAGLNFI